MAQGMAEGFEVIDEVTGDGTSGQLAFWAGTKVIDGSADLKWDDTNDILTLGGDVTLDASATNELKLEDTVRVQSDTEEVVIEPTDVTSDGGTKNSPILRMRAKHDSDTTTSVVSSDTDYTVEFISVNSSGSQNGHVAHSVGGSKAMRLTHDAYVHVDNRIIFDSFRGRHIQGTTHNGGEVIQFRNSMSSGNGNADGGFVFLNGDDSVVMKLNNSRVGIRTASPEVPLDVSGVLKIRRISDATDTDTQVNSEDMYFETSYWDGTATQNESFRLQAQRIGTTAGDMRLEVQNQSNNDLIRLTQGGVVAIGQTTLNEQVGAIIGQGGNTTSLASQYLPSGSFGLFLIDSISGGRSAHFGLQDGGRDVSLGANGGGGDILIRSKYDGNGPGGSGVAHTPMQITSEEQIIFYGGDPADGQGVLAIDDAATVPSNNPSSGVILYATSGELKVRDGGGNVSTLSPHSFDLTDPSEPMAWAYTSHRDEMSVEVDMMKAIRLVEELSGHDLVNLEAEDYDVPTYETQLDETRDIVERQQEQIEAMRTALEENGIEVPEVAG